MRRRGPSKDKIKLERGLEAEGFRPVAGAHKYQYWAKEDRKTGTFIRLSQRTVRVVRRYHGARGIEDAPLTQEVYFGKIKRPNAARILAEFYDKKA